MVSKNRIAGIILFALVGVAVVLYTYKDVLFPETDLSSKHVGEVLVDVDLTSFDEKTQKLSQVLTAAGGCKKAIVSMWATWCDPCIRELPLITRAQPELEKRGVKVVLVNYDGALPNKSLPQVKAWLISQRLDLVTFFDFGEQLEKTLNVSALPFSVGISAKRKIEWTELGELDWEKPAHILEKFTGL
ncbi:MAG: TlpA family protein disulfide reductase [Bdellovibrionales bacterium]|nr:TlpA family protein disulfide reductase [Bdellovibrionales bacterium]